MKPSKAFGGLLLAVFLLGAEPLLAGPSLPITKPPILDATILTGPPVDPPALNGQWFLNARYQESSRSHEFYDDAFAGSGPGAIFGYVSSITYDVFSNITAFSIQAAINNDTSAEHVGQAGNNSHGEQASLLTKYEGALLGVKLAAEFAVTDLANLPDPWNLPYRDRNPYIVADNEDQAAWYCWNPAYTNRMRFPAGAYYVPTWDFGDISPGQTATRQLDFSIPAGLSPLDSRYAVLRTSYDMQLDVLANRTTSLKISTWLDEVALDPFYGGEPLSNSDVSVFHNTDEIQQLDFGDAPTNYPTLLANEGARHIIVPSIYMGQLIDPELDGQPNALATGDDTNNLADEDGVFFPLPLVAGLSARADVICSTNGLLWAWIDYDANGGWAEAQDLVFSGQAVSPGTNQLVFLVPGTASNGYTFARFRFTTQRGSLSYTGLVSDGEVEDYRVRLFAQGEEPMADLGDAPDSSNSWGIPSPPMTAYPKGGPPGVLANYPTVFMAGSPPFGPRHAAPMLAAYLGATVSLENEADIGPDADGVNNLTPVTDTPDLDSIGGVGSGDDGVQFPLSLPHCRATAMTVWVMIPGLGQPPAMFLNVWFDWNRDGDWNDTLTCPDGNSVPEWAVQNFPVPLVAGLNPVLTPTFFCWHPTMKAGDPLWMRVTLAEQPWPPPGGGIAGGDGPAAGYAFGETEDYYVNVYRLDEHWDFGDAPDPSFPTLLASTGAQHAVISGFTLGTNVDAEADGQPNATATGDDINGIPNDEDGVNIVVPFTINTQGCVDVYLTSGPAGGLLDAWVDFDRNNAWDAGEQVFTNLALVPGANTNLCFHVPSSAQLGPTFARFRLSSAGGLAPSGPAQDGEVEDYQVTLYQQGPTADIVITNLVRTGAVAQIHWTAESGVKYQAQFSTNFHVLGQTDPTWEAWGDIVTGPANEQTDTNCVQSQKFYRVVAPYAPPP